MSRNSSNRGTGASRSYSNSTIEDPVLTNTENAHDNEEPGSNRPRMDFGFDYPKTIPGKGYISAERIHLLNWQAKYEEK